MEFSFEFYNELLFLLVSLGVAHHLSERFQIFLALQCSISYIKKFTYRPFGFSFQRIQPSKWIQEIVACVRKQFFLQARRKESDDESECPFPLIVY